MTILALALSPTTSQFPGDTTDASDAVEAPAIEVLDVSKSPA